MNYELNYLSVDDAQGFPLHSHDGYEIIYYFKIDGELQTDQENSPLSSGMISILPPNTMHRSDSKDGFTAIAMRGPFGNLLQFKKPMVINDNADHDAEALIRMIYRNRFNSDDYLTTLIQAFLHFILQNTQPEDSLTRAVRKIANELSERFYDCDLSPTNLLKESGYAEDYIRAHFKKVMGATPNGFLNTLRIDHARYLIEVYHSALALSEISERCGFTDYVYFSKKFKELVGLSPKEYKKQWD